MSAAVLAGVIAFVSPAVISLAGQGQTGTPTIYTPPRTPWGDPDIHGTYDVQTFVHLERPAELAGKTTRTDEEWAALEKTRSALPAGFGGAARGEFSTLAIFNGTNFVKDNRTALITDPPDGRVPLTEEGRKRYMPLEEYRRVHQQSYESWAEIGSYERCISRVIPRLNQNYNSFTQLVQSPGYVVFVYEQETRVATGRATRWSSRPRISRTSRRRGRP